MCLEKGSLEVHINNAKKKEISKGEGFGELALLYNAPRSASIKAIENCMLWGIDRHTFRNAVEEIMSKEYDINRKFIEDVKFFSKKKIKFIIYFAIYIIIMLTNNY